MVTPSSCGGGSSASETKTIRRPASRRRRIVVANPSVTMAVTTTNVAPQGSRGLSRRSSSWMEEVAKLVTAASASKMAASWSGERPGSTRMG